MVHLAAFITSHVDRARAHMLAEYVQTAAAICKPIIIPTT